MSHSSPQVVERHCDVCIVGGSVAGLAAALQLSRQRRSVIVVDSGEPRNAPAAHLHGYLGADGLAPVELVERGRVDVRKYGGEVLTNRVMQVSRTDDGWFRVELSSGHCVLARRVLAATGLLDRLPEVEGVAEHWGRGVVHCPFCHGFEVRDQRIVQIVVRAIDLHPTVLWRHLTDRFTLVLQDPALAADDRLPGLRAAGVDIRIGPVTRVVGDEGDAITGVELADGTAVEADHVVVRSQVQARVEPFVGLGLTTVQHAAGAGAVVPVDQTGQTAIPGLYAAGNVTDPSLQLAQAAAHGGLVGAMISFSLAEEDVLAAARPSANQRDWDHRYGGEQLWSGNPNGTLVQEVSTLKPGRVLDVGAGEGGDAMWLAEHGWTVTASDVSDNGLRRVRAAAQSRGLPVTCLHADANGRYPFPRQAFDLVSAQYASIPRTPDGRAVHNLLDAVAPGGSLLIVGHDPEAMQVMARTAEHGPMFDPDAYVGVPDVAAALAGSPEWTIDLHEKRIRPHGAVSTHHVEDIVLRARRAT
jgi:thioredoxin reductase/SAM-dependent methyltransferase